MEKENPVKFYNKRWFSVTVVAIILLAAGVLVVHSYSNTQSQMQRTTNAADELLRVTNGK